MEAGKLVVYRWFKCSGRYLGSYMQVGTVDVELGSEYHPTDLDRPPTLPYSSMMIGAGHLQ